MAKFTKADKALFAKGGRNKALPEDVKEARKVTRVEVERILAAISTMDDDQFRIYEKSPERNQLERTIISIFKKAIKEGDNHRLNFLLDRMVGPVPKIVDATVKEKGKSERVLDAVEQLKVLIYSKEKRK